MIKIGDFIIGEGNKTLVVAELSGNHNHDFELAMKTVKAAKDSGADAFKLQTFTPDSITIDCKNEYFTVSGGIFLDGRNLYDLYKELNTPWEWHQKIKEYCDELGLIFFSTPFDFSAVDFLEELKVPCYKIASFEITDIPLIEYAALKGKPMIISNGVANEEDLRLAIEACRKVGNNQIVILKCTSNYPAKVEEANLLTIGDIKKNFDVEVGLSDHSMGDIVAITSVALGARVVEKHFIIDRKLGGVDSGFSMEPHEFKRMVDSIREVEKALGIVTYDLIDSVKAQQKYSRSLFVVKDISQGEVITHENVRSIRPGNGLHPKFLKSILGKKANQALAFGTPMSLEFIS